MEPGIDQRDIENLLARLPPGIRGEVADGLDAIGMRRLPPEVSVSIEADGAVVAVGRHRVRLTENRGGSVWRLISRLAEARDRETRTALLVIAGALESEPPPWSLRMSKVLRRAIETAGKTATSVAGAAARQPKGDHPAFTLDGLKREDGSSLRSCSVFVVIRDDALCATIEVGEGVRYREKAFSEVVVEGAVPHALRVAMPGRPPEDLIRHPLLDGLARRIIGSRQRTGDAPETAFRVEVDWQMVTELPDRLAAIFPWNDPRDLDSPGWRWPTPQLIGRGGGAR